MLIFSQERGRVARVDNSDANEVAVFTFPSFDYLSLHAIITGNSLEYMIQHQAMDTLGSDVLLSSFGDAVRPMVFSGVVFQIICENENIPADQLGEVEQFGETDFAVQRQAENGTGPERIIEWFKSQNLSRRSAPIEIVFGSSTVIRGYMYAINLTSRNPKDRVVDFQLAMLKVPDRPEIEDSRFAEAVNEDLSTGDNFVPIDLEPGTGFEQLPTNPTLEQLFNDDVPLPPSPLSSSGIANLEVLHEDPSPVQLQTVYNQNGTPFQFVTSAFRRTNSLYNQLNSVAQRDRLGLSPQFRQSLSSNDTPTGPSLSDNAIG